MCTYMAERFITSKDHVLTKSQSSTGDKNNTLPTHPLFVKECLYVLYYVAEHVY